MDFTALIGSLVNTAVTFLLDTFLNGLFAFLSDLFFGAPIA
ncbi:MAG TPA: hypothetical protein PLZ53_08040 [Candidatus Hydrogenedentes bacterium]|jgi:hypothetical protein|nr:MAG: hypothetical protein BWY07_00738 [Candidatus Hydrogenedentes bacterium ADurb.Bin170]HNZ48342.1 hypothetical protein [Candidatus Hydrogenedentota bacterium]HOD95536.1 hypothetical protein [Candidatus Hydrogenedentota bacterium]HOH43055.1 hypothetical protein [Candidatus Hydrogenedentota bacterium]HOM48455.1 hypothetical protein [Candidatus Hydrogenedentota bacterium]